MLRYSQFSLFTSAPSCWQCSLYILGTNSLARSLACLYSFCCWCYFHALTVYKFALHHASSLDYVCKIRSTLQYCHIVSIRFLLHLVPSLSFFFFGHFHVARRNKFIDFVTVFSHHAFFFSVHFVCSTLNSNAPSEQHLRMLHINYFYFILWVCVCSAQAQAHTSCANTLFHSSLVVLIRRRCEIYCFRISRCTLIVDSIARGDSHWKFK